MALSASVSHVIRDNGTEVLITDDTVYGNGSSNATRAQCLLTFELQYIPNNGGATQDITINYDPETAEQVLADISSDGYYVITMTIVNNPDGSWAGADFSYQAVQRILVTDRYCACWSEKSYEVYNQASCGCEDWDTIQKLLLMQVQYDGIVNMVSRSDVAGAAKALERLQLQCDALGCSCAC